MKTLTSFFLLLLSFSLMAQGPVTLKLNLEKGKTYKLKQTNTQNMKQSVNGQQFSTDVFSRMAISFKVLSLEADVMTIAFKFDTIYNKMTSPMGAKESNSAVISSKKDPKDILMNKVSSLVLMVKISTAGKFVGFANYSNFKDSVMMALDSVPATKQDKARKIAEIILKEANVQSMIEPFFAYLPEKAVAVNDTWDTNVVMSADKMSMMMFNTYTLKAADHKEAQITIASQMESIPSNDPTAAQTALKGNFTGTGTVDIATGLAMDNKTQGHLSGTATVKQQDKTMEVQIESDSHSTVAFIK